MTAQEVILKARRGELPTIRNAPSPKDPPVVPSPPPKPSRSSSFSVRLLGAVGVGAGIGGEVLFFQFWDMTNNLTAFYIYAGGGLSASAKVMPKGTGTGSGIWNPFKTVAPVSVGSFASAARFTSAGCGPWTANYLNVIADEGSGKALYLSLSTGVTWGAGASTTVGRLTWYPPEIMPYSGD
jgi:hypothetical protein